MKPMLAGKAPADLAALRYPVLVSPKLDGVRALVIAGVVLSRNLKPIPNQWVQKLFGRADLNGLDGELIVGKPTDPACYRATMSGVMSEEGEPDVRFYAFDLWNYETGESGYAARFHSLHALTLLGRLRPLRELTIVRHIRAMHPSEVEAEERERLAQGYEGVMLRDPEGPYKEGRSTTKEGWLLKLKRFEDSEAEILGVTELMHNANEATKDALGRTKRSSHQAGKVGRGTLGALVVRDLATRVQFELGTGFDQATRDSLWATREQLIGRLVKYKHFPSGSKDKPRFPVFLGFRHPSDR